MLEVMTFATLLAQTSHIWHFWLAVVLAPTVILTVVGIAALYVVKVSKTRYPRD